MKLLKSMLTVDPVKRISSKQVLEATQNAADIIQRNYLADDNINFKKQRVGQTEGRPVVVADESVTDKDDS